jgi:hypothetical protein
VLAFLAVLEKLVAGKFVHPGRQAVPRLRGHKAQVSLPEVLGGCIREAVGVAEERQGGPSRRLCKWIAASIKLVGVLLGREPSLAARTFSARDCLVDDVA